MVGDQVQVSLGGPKQVLAGCGLAFTPTAMGHGPVVMPGHRAHLAVWDAEPGSLDEATGLPDLAGGAPYPECAVLLVDGRVVHDPAGLLPVPPTVRDSVA